MSERISLKKILTLATQVGASDTHLKHDSIPIIRKNGRLQLLVSCPINLTGALITEMMKNILSAHQMDTFEKTKDLDVAYSIDGIGRFRLNICQERGQTRLVARHICEALPDLDDLGIPPIVKKIAEKERGLVLVAGPTGVGKTTTLLGMVNHINRNFKKHILTIENPIEFIVLDQKSLVTQRELDIDTHDFHNALKHALRQDPDVILVGEMRDEATIEICLTAAETGHLVLSTLHTTNSYETINRILSSLKPERQQNARIQLASVLQAVISQRLIPRKDGSGLIPATEVMVNTKHISNLISNPNEMHKIPQAIEEGGHVWEMHSFNNSLLKLLKEKKIGYRDALKFSDAPEDLNLSYERSSSLQEDKKNKDKENGEDQTQTPSEEEILSLDLSRRGKKKQKSKQDTTPLKRYGYRKFFRK